MKQAIIIQNTNYLIPNKEHRNFTTSNESASVGEVLVGNFKNVNGLRKGKPFVYRLFFTKDGKILYANCIKTENVPSEILSAFDNEKNQSEIEFNGLKTINLKPVAIVLTGAFVGYFVSKNQNSTKSNTIKHIAIGAIGAYAIYLMIRNKPIIETSNK